MSSREAGPLGPAQHLPSDRCLDDASYVLGSLSPSERQTYEQHLATCTNCQASVAKLAGLPGLLALTTAAELENEHPPVPDTLLPRLLRASASDRRRRRWIWTGTVAAAAACVIALAITIVIRPTASTADPLPAPIVMQPLVDGPMEVSLQLVDKQWGTSIVINCEYGAVHDVGVDYQLVVYDAAGKAQPVGWWMSVPGAKSTVWTASSLRLKNISRVVVELSDGLPVLAAVPQHS